MSTRDNTTNISPASNLVAITKSDSTTYSPYIRAIYVGIGGNVVVQDVDGTTITFASVPQGTTIGPFVVQKVMDATTASSLVGFI